MSERIKNTNNVDEFETLDLPDAVVETADWTDDVADIDDDAKKTETKDSVTEEFDYEALPDEVGYKSGEEANVDALEKIEKFHARIGKKVLSVVALSGKE